jgi:hypothetical protein
MTQREFLNKVIATPNIAEDVKTEAESLIAKLDTKNEQRKGKQTKTQKENEPIANAIIEALSKGAMLSVDLATAIGQTVNKTNGVAGVLVNEGKLTKAKVKVKGKGEQTEYTLVVEVATANEEAEAVADEVAEAED